MSLLPDGRYYADCTAGDGLVLRDAGAGAGRSGRAGRIAGRGRCLAGRGGGAGGAGRGGPKAAPALASGPSSFSRSLAPMARGARALLPGAGCGGAPSFRARCAVLPRRAAVRGGGRRGDRRTPAGRGGRSGAVAARTARLGVARAPHHSVLCGSVRRGLFRRRGGRIRRDGTCPGADHPVGESRRGRLGRAQRWQQRGAARAGARVRLWRPGRRRHADAAGSGLGRGLAAADPTGNGEGPAGALPAPTLRCHERG